MRAAFLAGLAKPRKRRHSFTLMTEKQFETGHCTECRRNTSAYCDECKRWVCPEHARTIKVTGGGSVIHLCPGCSKKAKPGNVVGGVLLQEWMFNN